MISRLVLTSTLLASAVFAQGFDPANRLLSERSYSRACEAFTAYLKGNAADREALAKRSYACTAAGKGDRDALRKVADTGEKDFGRAWANHALYEVGERGLDPALPLLKQAAGGEGRTADEAKAALVRDALTELDRQSYNLLRVEQMTELALQYATAGADQARAHFGHARARLNQNQKPAEAEKELAEVGAGSSELADDALYLIAQRRESEHTFDAALELYDSIVRRFSPTTSNLRSSAESRAADIRRPWVSLGASYTELPQVKPQIAVTWRNVSHAKWTLSRVDPLTAAAGTYPDDPDDYLATATATVSTWSSSLTVASSHEQGTTQFDLDAKDPGAYVLQVDADGQRSRTWVLITQTAVATKTDGQKLLIFVADSESGAAKPEADVAVFVSRSNSAPNLKLTGRTNADGVATFTLDRTSDSLQVWTRTGTSWAFSRAGSASSSSWSREELAYVMTDRPLYKPGETVGFKVFLRTREGGPSTPLPGRAFTLHVTDAQGKQVLSAPLKSNEFGTASTSYPLPKNAPLGAWSMSVEANDVSYRQDGRAFRVEEYKPPEYLVSVEPLGNPKPGEPVKVKVKTSYYSGGAVANASGRAVVTISPWQHQWSPWPNDAREEGEEGAGGDEEDDRGLRRWNRSGSYTLSTSTVLFKTGADGTAELTLPGSDPAQGYPSLNYRVQVFVTDASRREIQGQGSIKVVAATYFVDVRTSHDIYRPGERVAAKLRAEDANGRPVSADVIVRLSRLKDAGGQATIAEVRTKVVNGKGSVVLDADALGRARVEIFDALTAPEAALAQTDLWLTSDSKPLAPPAQGFQLYVDRAALKAGDKVRALVATNRPGGHALVTIESDAVHAVKVVELKGRAAFVELQLSAGMAPNAWLSALRFEDTQALSQSRPIRVSGSEVEFPVRVDFGRASAEPGSKVAAQVSSKVQGQSEVSLTVVDEALFAIEPERTDFLSFFGRTRREQTVRTAWSQYERSYRARPQPVVAQPVTVNDKRSNTPAPREQLDEGQAASGAARGAPMKSAEAPASAPAQTEDRKELSRMKKKDSAMADDAASPADPAAAEVKARTDFGSSAGWFPALTAANGTLTQPLVLTDSLTSWKAVATVVTPTAALGQGTAHLRTAKPLMVRLQAPRFFVEGDEVVLSAVIESHLPKATELEVTLLAPGFRELSPAKKVVHVEPEQTLRFDAKFKVVALGERTLKAVVRGGGSSDAMEWKLPAFVHGSAQRQYFSGRLNDVNTFEFDLPEKRKASLTRLELTLSPSLLAVMFDGLPYLAAYPYGCVEQTLSRFVPATIARRAVKDLHLPAERVPADLDDMVQKGLERLASFQHPDGGWGWWQSDTTNDWMTAYVVYALSLAREAGVAVPADELKRGREYLVGHLGRELDTPETHAFMVFALASTGGAPKAAVNTLFDRRTTLSARARAQLALALLSTKDPRARIAVENLDDVVKAAESRADASVGEANDVWSTSAAIEATAFTLMAYTRYDLRSKLIAPLTDFLVLRRNGGRWRNTRDTAFAIYALSELARAEHAATSSATFLVSINGQQVKRVQVKNGGLELMDPLVFADAGLKAGKNVIRIGRDGGGTGYWSGTFDVFNMNDFIKGVGGDVKLKRSYSLLGRPGNEKSNAPTEYGMPVESGVRVRVDLEITANKAVEFVMLEDLKPAGFEAVELRSGPQVCNYACAHAELRTDRVAMFLSQLPVGTTRLSYELRAEVPGRFAALPARLEAMYAPEITSTADEMRFEVRDEPPPVATSP